MIFLRSIRLEKFKGIDNLTCDFDDLTVLAGLNNSGKTSLLQAIYLLCSCLRPLAEHSNLASPKQTKRTVDLNQPISKLGLPNIGWLLQGPTTPFLIAGTFWDDTTVQIQMTQPGQFCFTVLPEVSAVDSEAIVARMMPLKNLTAEFFRPPGMLPSRENMLAGEQYRSNVAAGQSSYFWRNSIWWGIQGGGGPESFEPVIALIHHRFPGVSLRQPTLGAEGNPPPIIISYDEKGGQPRDIAQSGAGLHTFVSLAQLMKQSSAGILLLDEPDSHLHPSQQSVVLELLNDLALTDERQVILATHSPELICRTTRESRRWLQPGVTTAEGGIDNVSLLDRLGATADFYLSKTDFPEVIVYVEGNEDKPLIEALISWCTSEQERHSGGAPRLPTVLVVRHKDGKFDAVALQAISRIAAELRLTTRVVGIRDLDWDYTDCDPLPPGEEMQRKEGNGYLLLTLMCKELENLLCDAALLSNALGGIDRDVLKQIINEESLNEEIVREWRYHAEPQIRDRLPSKDADHTREEKAEKEFERWRDDPDTRIRLVAGKSLIGRVRRRLQLKGHRISNTHVFRNLQTLNANWLAIAKAIFPSLSG
jgi:hypothetical protein